MGAIEKKGYRFEPEYSVIEQEWSIYMSIKMESL